MRTYRDDMLALVDQLHAQGVSRYAAAPPLWRLAWLLGWRMPLPAAMPFGKLLAVNAVFFAVAWGVLMWLMTWRAEGHSPFRMVSTSLVAGVTFGAITAASYRRQRPQLDRALAPRGDDR